jgi:3-phenylpropionate/trans-cinnamate dioxygenase ferredoxin reductase subunit
MTQDTIAIVGAGMAGGRAAITLRKEGFDGRLLLIGEEQGPPYERPPLSKEYLRGEKPAEEIAIAPKDGGWADAGVELRTGTRVTRLDPANWELQLQDGERVAYDRALLATGSEPRRLDVPGADLQGILTLRTVGDSDRIREQVTGAHRVVVIGGGWIGAEVAACARQLGAEVVLLTGRSRLLERHLGIEVATFLEDLHRAHGVELRSGDDVAGFGAADGRVANVRLADGSSIEAPVVVVGIGVTPRLDLARDAGLETGKGVHVDELFRSSAPDVFAVGDIAEVWHPLLNRRVRLDHWAAAWFGGPAAAKSMLGQGAPYERIPYFYSDQFELNMESWGVPPEWEQVVIRGDPGSGSFLGFWLKDGAIVGTMHANQPDARKPLEALARTRPTLAPSRLADTSVPLTDLLPAPSA